MAASIARPPPIPTTVVLLFQPPSALPNCAIKICNFSLPAGIRLLAKLNRAWRQFVDTNSDLSTWKDADRWQPRIPPAGYVTYDNPPLYCNVPANYLEYRVLHVAGPLMVFAARIYKWQGEAVFILEENLPIAEAYRRNVLALKGKFEKDIKSQIALFESAPGGWDFSLGW